MVDPSEVVVTGQDVEDGGTEEQDIDEGGIEEEGPPPEEEEASAERPAEGGGGRVSIELAGLPVGGGEVLDVDGTWCQVLFWRSVPAGVWLDIDSVRVGDQGGTILSSGCEGSPPCAGVRISADEPGGCAVMIRPPSPGIEFVEVQLNGTLSCPDQASCDAIGATDGSWTMITNPTGGGQTEGGATEGGTTGEGGPTEESSTQESNSPEGDGGSAEDATTSERDDDLATPDTG